MPRFLLFLVLALAGLAAIPPDAAADHRHRWNEVRIGFVGQGPWSPASHSSCGDRDHDRCGRGRPDCGSSSWDRRRYSSCDHHDAVPILRRLWVPATYRTVVVGYSRCGEPRYRHVRVPGYWDEVVTGHRCGSCGATW